MSNKNVIFKYNYCDGGATSEQIGYNGVCKAETVLYNVNRSDKVWCSHPNSDCSHFYECQQNNRAYADYNYVWLKDGMKDGGFICYESKIFRDDKWQAHMGWDNRGQVHKPRKLSEWVRQNSLCVLSTREPYKAESERIIFGVFLVKEFVEGSEETQQEGYVMAHEKYKLKFSLKEARQLLVWNYYANNNNPTNPKWGSQLTRKMSDENAIALLFDIVRVKKDTKDELLAKEFYEHFCDLNKVNPNNPPEAYGALQMGKSTV